MAGPLSPWGEKSKLKEQNSNFSEFGYCGQFKVQNRKQSMNSLSPGGKEIKSERTVGESLRTPPLEGVCCSSENLSPYPPLRKTERGKQGQGYQRPLRQQTIGV